VSQRYDVLIVGAGMVGATAALAFARKGYQVALMERELLDDFDITGSDDIDLRVSAISPASQQLLSELGVWPEVQRLRSCDYHEMHVWHEHGDAQMHFSAQQIAASHLGTIVENRSLVAVLIQHLRYLKNVDLFHSCMVSQIEQSDDRVAVVTSEGKTIQAGLLLAADGRQSGVRSILEVSVVSGDYHQSAIVANVKTGLPHQNTAWQRFLATGPLAFLPLWNGQCSIVWSADTQYAESLMALPDDKFNRSLEAAFESRLGSIEGCSQRAIFPLNWHQANQWLSGRVLLIGDAAHGVHPLAGQGVNLGFSDVAVLIALFSNGEDLYQPKRLRRFERQRKAETVLATHLFTTLKHIYAQQNDCVCQVRDMGMKIVDGMPLIRFKVIQNAINSMS
jgi:ubiquinone biosynthesis UbiH/UbiF/VisC/COQ6 family hydroxylase